MNVVAIVVTYNRLNLLKENIKSLLNQEVKPNEVIIINNNSNDGTEEYLKELENSNDKFFSVYNLEENIGGAGGFNLGLKYASQKKYDYYWIMDDDTIANKDTLCELMDAANKIKSFGFLCSNVLWTDNTACKMNKPKLAKDWNQKVCYNLIKVENASFVSLFLSHSAIEKCGLPIGEFFIWGDDLEYTKRISNKFNNYLVLDSKVTHKMKSNNSIDIIKDDNRLDRYYYEYRNKLYIYKRDKNILLYITYIIKSVGKIIVKSKKFKLRKINIIIKGCIDGIKFNPRIEEI